MYVKNFVLIDELNLDFHECFSCFTGETGAGKSLLIDAISILCGGRVSVQSIQKGASKAFIEALIDPVHPHHPAIQLLEENGYELEEGCFTLSREFSVEGKSITRINSRQTTLSFVKEVMSLMIDIHSQHDTQYLLNARYHLSLLDAYVKQTQLSGEVEASYKQYQKIKKEKDAFENEEANPDDLEYLKFQLNEMEQIEIKEGEAESLEQEIHEMSSFEKQSSSLQEGLSCIQNSGYEKLYDSAHYLNESDSESIQEIREDILNSYYSIEEQVTKLAAYINDMEFDETLFNEKQQRLFDIKKIMRKHGNSYLSFMEEKNKIENRIQAIENRQEHVVLLEKKEKEAFDIYYQIALKLSDIRKTKAKALKVEIEQQLNDLQLSHAKFDVSFEETISAHGIDKVEFLISMNPGEDLKPLAKVASGGELSRLMLGLKSIFNALAQIETIIFDEIDNGVSGSVANSIGKKMKYLANHAQVFAVTHLAPVAVWADCHYLVEKTNELNHTNTNISQLEKEGVIKELALIATGNDNEHSLSAAKELYESVHSNY